MGGCGCGGATNVYKAPAAREKAKPAAPPPGSRPGFPAVWNGPKAKAKEG